MRHSSSELRTAAFDDVFLTVNLLLVTGLGVVGLRYGREVFIDRCRFVAQPTDDLRAAQRATARADATFRNRMPATRVTAGSGVGVGRVDPDAGAAPRGIAGDVTPGSTPGVVGDGRVGQHADTQSRVGYAAGGAV